MSGSPLRSIAIENPDSTGATSNRLHVTDGEGYVSAYEWTGSGWMLSKGDGLTNEKKTFVWSESNTVCIATNDILSGAEQLITRRIREYVTNSAAGMQLVAETLGSGSAAKTNHFLYYTNGPGRGFVKELRAADGSWELMDYTEDEFLETKYYAFLNQPPTNNAALCRSVEYSYATNVISGSGDLVEYHPDVPRLTVEYVLGVEVARSYAVRLNISEEERFIQCVNPGDPWNASSNLVTVRKRFTTGADKCVGRERADRAIAKNQQRGR